MGNEVDEIYYLNLAELAYLAALKGIKHMPGFIRGTQVKLSPKDIYYARFSLEQKGLILSGNNLSLWSDLTFKSIEKARNAIYIRSFNMNCEDLVIFSGKNCVIERMSVSEQNKVGLSINDYTSTLEYLESNNYFPQCHKLYGGDDKTGYEKLSAGIKWVGGKAQVPIVIANEIDSFITSVISIYDLVQRSYKCCFLRGYTEGKEYLIQCSEAGVVLVSKCEMDNMKEEMRREVLTK